MDSGKYSPLQQAHQRIKNEQQVQANAKEMTEPRAEHKDRDQAKPARVEKSDRAAETTAAPTRPDAAASQRIAIPTGPGPNESTGHYEWRRETIARIERERVRDAARKASIGTQVPEGSEMNENPAKPPLKRDAATVGKEREPRASRQEEPDASVEQEQH